VASDLRAAAEALCDAVEGECTASGPYGLTRANELLTLCVAVRHAALSREPSDEEVAAEAAAAWYCTSAPTTPQLAYARDLVRSVNAARERARGATP
jgi:hypothetical protein